MTFKNFLSLGFGATFLMIALSGLLLAFSVQAALIGLVVAFVMNLSLFGVCFFNATLDRNYLVDDLTDNDFDVHP